MRIVTLEDTQFSHINVVLLIEMVSHIVDSPADRIYFLPQIYVYLIHSLLVEGFLFKVVFLSDDLVLHLVILKALLLVHPEIGNHFVQIHFVHARILKLVQ